MARHGAGALLGALCTLATVGGWMWGFKSLCQVDCFEDASPGAADAAAVPQQEKAEAL